VICNGVASVKQRGLSKTIIFSQAVFEHFAMSMMDEAKPVITIAQWSVEGKFE